MARLARKISDTGYHHVMLKGIDDRNIFLDDHDRRVFISIMKKVAMKEDVTILMYCLMNNHVHLIIKEGEELGTSIKRITVKYSKYHNQKYERSGHLFKNRYKSEPVNDRKHFFNLFNYIHHNPVRAGIVDTPFEYPWSSINNYVSYTNSHITWLNTELTQKIIGTNENIITCLNSIQEVYVPSWKLYKRWSDDELSKEIKPILGNIKLAYIAKEDRDKLIQGLYEQFPVSQRQLSRVLGISRGIIQRAIK